MLVIASHQVLVAGKPVAHTIGSCCEQFIAQVPQQAASIIMHVHAMYAYTPAEWGLLC
jgi:hypothetical protein